MRSLKLPDDHREELKRPLGELYRGDGLECIEAMAQKLRRATKVLAVGDITAYYLLEGGIEPDLIIVDHKTKRKPAPDHVRDGISQPSYRTLEVDNPPATLSNELIEMIRVALLGDERLKIVVNGEEDLATLPVILHAPLGSAVVYGQPGEGSVLVSVTIEKKDYIKELMDRMIAEE